MASQFLRSFPMLLAALTLMGASGFLDGTFEKLDLTIVSASGLRDADSWPYGNSDPYCVCQIKEYLSETVQTEVVQESHYPEWKHRGVITYVPGNTLWCRVFDKDSSTDDLLGEVSLSSAAFYPQGFEDSIRLSSQGYLRLQIQPFTTTTSTTLPPLTSLKVTIVSARGLICYTRSGADGSDDGGWSGWSDDDDDHDDGGADGSVEVSPDKCRLSCMCETDSTPGVPGSGLSLQTPEINGSHNPVWEHHGELPFRPGDNIYCKISGFDGVEDDELHNLFHHNLFYHVVVGSAVFHPHGFEGELQLEPQLEHNRSLTLRIQPMMTQAAQAGTTAASLSDQKDTITTKQEEVPETTATQGLMPLASGGTTALAGQSDASQSSSQAAPTDTSPPQALPLELMTQPMATTIPPTRQKKCVAIPYETARKMNAVRCEER